MTTFDTSLSKYTGALRQPDRVSAMLRGAWDECHLVSPATACATVLDGWSVTFSAVLINVDRETYLVGGGDDDGPRGNRRNPQPTDRLGLTKSALDRIAMAAAVSWDPRLTVRLDDGRDPHYCRCVAVGRYELFDGSSVVCQGDKEVDLRDGSDYVEQMRWHAKRQDRDCESRLRMERTHILSACMTKARNRAVRTLGVHTWYTRDELQRKPFVVVRAQFTGQSDDPELRRQFAVMIARNHMRATSALYEGAVVDDFLMASQPISAPPVGTPEAEPEPIPAPQLFCEYCGRLDHVTIRTTPAGEIRYCSESLCMELAFNDAKREESDARAKAVPAPAKEQPKPEPPKPAPAPGPKTMTPESYRAAPTVDPPEQLSGFKMPGGRSAGKPIDLADDNSLHWWIDTIDKNLCAGTKPQYADQDRRLLEAMRAEVNRRSDIIGEAAPY